VQKRLGKRVRVLRKAKGLSQAELAEAIGRSEKTVGRLERGEPSIIDVVVDLASALGVDILGLFEGVSGRKSSEMTMSNAKQSVRADHVVVTIRRTKR